jgi:hypothetical protein
MAAAADTSSSSTGSSTSENTAPSRNDNDNEYFAFDGSPERSVLVERNDIGQPTGYVCAHVVEKDGAWLEF